MAKHFKEIRSPLQKHFDSRPFPSILAPDSPALTSLASFVNSIQTEKAYLESSLHKTGAVLFRGFPINTASDFNQVVEAFGFEGFTYVGSAIRTNVVGRVFTANESPLDQKVPFHHEMSQLPVFPSKLFFYCEEEPRTGCGGETPLALSHVVHDKVKEKHPEFVQRLDQHGLIYCRVVGENDDPSSPIGRGWKSFFSTEDKTVAEERAAEVGMKLEWLEDGRVKTIRGPKAAILQDKSRNRKIWFNNIVGDYGGWVGQETSVTFGDGKELPRDIVYDCGRILEEESVAIPWNKGDFVLIDNLAVLHARNPCSSYRRVLASLCK